MTSEEVVQYAKDKLEYLADESTASLAYTQVLLLTHILEELVKVNTLINTDWPSVEVYGVATDESCKCFN